MFLFSCIRKDTGRSGHYLNFIFTCFFLAMVFEGKVVYDDAWNDQQVLIDEKIFRKHVARKVVPHKTVLLNVPGSFAGLTQQQFLEMQRKIREEDPKRNTLFVFKNPLYIRSDTILRLGFDEHVRRSFKDTVLRKIYFSDDRNITSELHVISIHARRGDLAKRLIAAGFDKKYYSNLIRELKGMHPSKKIHIYTEKVGGQDLKGLSNNENGVTLFFGDASSVKEHFNCLVRSTVIVPGPSSFSILAAEMSRGTVYFDEMILKFRPALLCYHETKYPDNFVVFCNKNIAGIKEKITQ